MTIQCCASSNCKSNENTTVNGAKIKLFPFPTDRKVFQHWESLCPAISNDAKESSQHKTKLLCELHFDKNCFDSNNHLKPNAVPIIEKKRKFIDSGNQQCPLKRMSEPLESSLSQNGNSSSGSDSDEFEFKPYRLTIHIDKILTKPCPKSKKLKQIQTTVTNLQESISKTIHSGMELSKSIEDQDSNMCLTCEEKFTDFSDLYTHLQEHFVCDICKQQFSSRKFHQKHYDLHRSSKTSFPYKCHICDLLFETKEAISDHNHISMNQYSNESDEARVHYCKSCNMTFSNEITFREHLDSHFEKVTHSVLQHPSTTVIPSSGNS